MTLTAFPSAAETPPVRLGGVLALDASRHARWCWSGTFRFPVGHPLALDSTATDGTPPYRVNRNVGEAGGHQGADLDNRRSGDPVRAAAHGLALSAADGGWSGGYGGHVVLAHRLPDESLVYSVYAHLAAGSVRVRAGDAVFAGETLGRVGRTGRATTAHLHFEIRRPGDPGERWERARVVDPIAFVTARLPLCADTTDARALLAWAEDAALITADARGGAALDRARWWTMLARGACHALDELPADPAGLGPALVDAGLLDPDAGRGRDGLVRWEELRSDLERARRHGLRLPPAVSLPREAKAREPRGNTGSPTVADACRALAEVATPTTPAESERPRARRGSRGS